MPTSSYQGDVSVQIAFDSGWATPAASRTWTDVSAYVELDKYVTISWGRGDERSAADANQLSLTLDNRDGRFTAGNTSGAYYPNVKVGRPIRVKIDPVDGSEVVYFTGYVNGWPTEWSDGTDATAYATISASSRLARLGTQRALKSIVETTILTDLPDRYYTLGETEGSTQANDSSGNKRDPLILAGEPSIPIVFGSATGPGTDGLTAAQFAGVTAAGGPTPSSQYLTGQVLTSANFTIETSFLIEASHASGELFALTNSARLLGVYVDLNGRLNAVGNTGTVITSTATFAAGVTHHVALTVNGTTWTLYGNGVSVATGAVTAVPSGLYDLSLGYIPLPAASGVGIIATTQALNGVLAHAALFTSVLTSTQIGYHATAESTGFAGETTSARLIRYANLAGIATAEVDAEAGSTTMQHLDATDKQVVELMRVCETTEGGVLYDKRDGSLGFQNRGHRYTASSIYTLNMAQHTVESGYSPRVDLAGLANDVSAQDVSGAYTAHVFDQDSIDGNGFATASVETASQDKDEPLNLASWVLYESKDPKERAPNLDVDVLAQVGKTPNSSAVLATTVGDKITVSNRPSQASSSSIDYFVEGGSLTIAPESMRLSLNVSPSAPYDQVLVWDDPVRGAVDTYPIAL